jgi:hypothetical protein
LAFLFGFAIYKPLKIDYVAKVDYNYEQHGRLKIFFILSSILYIIAQISSYWQNGIPLLQESRLLFFYEQGLIGGTLNKIIIPTRIIVIILTIHYLLTGKKNFRYFSYLMIIFCIISSILSGAKSSFIDLLFIAFCYRLFASKYLPYDKAKTLNVTLIYIAILLSLSTLLMTALLNPDFNPLIYLAMRMIQSGDTYFYAYPNDVIEYVTQSNIIVALFPGLSKAFDIINSDNIPMLGIELYRKVNLSIAIEGPNARHNVFGLAYLGPYWSVLYSFILGNILGFVRSGLFRLLPGTPFYAVIYVGLFILIYGIESDANMALGNLIGFIIFCPLLIMASQLFKISSKKTGESRCVYGELHAKV